MKKSLITLMLLLSCSSISMAAESYTLDTKSNNFFENVVNDTMLLLDNELRKSLTAEIASIIEHARFTQETHSWQPRISPRGQLTGIYSNINNSNIKDSFSALIKPVVEMACVSQQYDPMNSLSSKCIKELLKFQLSDPIRINYSYNTPKTIDQHIDGLSGLNNGNRYQQIVRTTADMLNSAYQKSQNVGVDKNVTIVKRPLVLVVPGKGTRSVSTGSGTTTVRRCGL